MPTVRLENVAKIYKNSRRGVSATLEVDLTIRQGEFVFINGGRGAGKTTLAQLITGELEPDRGAVWLGGADLTHLPQSESAHLRDCIGAVSEDSGLNPSETLFKNLASGNYLEYLRDRLFHGARIEKALALVGLSGSGHRFARELTSSECRRAELARAIWRSPSILVLDGLTAHTDDDTVWDMLHLLTALNERGTTVILTTDGSYGSILNKRVIALREGKVESDSPRG